MTETTPPVDPGVLVGIQHPDNTGNVQHARFFGIDPEGIEDHARRWWADGTRDLRWLDGKTWVVDESDGPAEPPFPGPPEQADAGAETEPVNPYAPPAPLAQ